MPFASMYVVLPPSRSKLSIYRTIATPQTYVQNLRSDPKEVCPFQSLVIFGIQNSQFWIQNPESGRRQRRFFPGADTLQL